MRFLDREQILKVIDFMERNVGKRRAEVKFEQLGIGNLDLVLKAFEAYYSFCPLRIEDVLGEGSPWASSAHLRREVFRWVNERYGGFVSLTNYAKFFQAVERRWGIPAEKIEGALWLDWEENFRLKKTTALKPEEMVEGVAARYGYLSLLRVLKKARQMLLMFEQQMSTEFVKDVYWLCKRFWMLCDFPSHTKCEIYPPEEMLPRDYGFILSKILRFTLKYPVHKVVVWLGRRKISLARDTLARCLRVHWVEEERLKFDSTVEEKFYHLFGEERGRWTLRREPAPIIREDVIFIPDFLLEKGDKKFYLEVVGYWRESYRRSKREKLKRLRDLPILLLVDKKFQSEFWDLGFPIFVYEKGHFPIWQIVDFLSKQDTKQLEVKVQTVLQKRAEIMARIGQLLGQKKFLTIGQMATILGCFEEEVAHVVKEAAIRSESFVFVKRVGMMDRAFYEYLSRQDFSGSLSTVREKLAQMRLPVELLDELGYRIRWKSLGNARVEKIS